MNKHLIIGGNGTIGKEVAKNLHQQGADITIASRNPVQVNKDDNLITLDVLNDKNLPIKLEGFDVVHLLIGLPYNSKAWLKGFPKAINNVIYALKRTGAKLVYFDNVYMYGSVKGWMTEETPVNPSSVKGKARAIAARTLMGAVEKGYLDAMICRSADFYGDYPIFDIIKQIAVKLKDNKKAQLLISEKFRHSLTFIPDAGKAVAFLSSRKEAYNQIWHVPTDKNALTTKELVETIADILEVRAQHEVIPKAILRLVSLFNKTLLELLKLSYQWENDYLFDSSKIEEHYGLEPTPIEQGIREHLNTVLY